MGNDKHGNDAGSLQRVRRVRQSRADHRSVLAQRPAGIHRGGNVPGEAGADGDVGVRAQRGDKNGTQDLRPGRARPGDVGPDQPGDCAGELFDIGIGEQLAAAPPPETAYCGRCARNVAHKDGRCRDCGRVIWELAARDRSDGYQPPRRCRSWRGTKSGFKEILMDLAARDTSARRHSKKYKPDF